MKVGDDVFYWTRRKGEPAQLIKGRITAIREGCAQLLGYDSDKTVHSIDLKRLKPIAELPPRREL